MPDPINCPPGTGGCRDYGGPERRERGPGSYCHEDRWVTELAQRVDRLTGLIAQYQVLDSRVKTVERVIEEIETCLRSTSGDIHKIQMAISQNSQARAWVERVVTMFVAALVTYMATRMGVPAS